ncbi:MAG: hypothetical protein ACHP8A_07040 [Terriglobales bacterium]
MRFAKSILVAAMAVAVVGYALDCSAVTTPEQSMQCCKSMRCSSHARAHKAQDCCRDMAMSHAPFVQSANVRGAPLVPVVLAISPVFDIQALTFSVAATGAQSHAPPIFVLPAPVPIRI